MELIPGLSNDIARECMIRIPYKHLFKESAVCKGWKSDIESDEFHNFRKVSGFGRVIAVLAQAELNRDDDDDGGLIKNPGMPAYQLTVFEPETGVWERLPPLPGYSKGIPLFCQCIGVDHSLVVIGGWDPSNWKVSSAVYVYNFISGTWRRGADMPGPRRSFFAAASGSDGEEKMVFVAGGHDEEKNALRSALVYNVVADKWIHIADMAMERDECKGIFHGGMFHVIGGYSSEMQGQFCKSIESFEVDTWQWSGVKEEILQNPTCPKSYIINEIDELIYNFAGDTVAVSSSDGATWKSVTEVPSDVRVGMNVMTWKGKTIAIGSMKYGGPHNCYMLEGAKWTRIATPEEYTGHVQTGCILEM